MRFAAKRRLLSDLPAKPDYGETALGGEASNTQTHSANEFLQHQSTSTRVAKLNGILLPTARKSDDLIAFITLLLTRRCDESTFVKKQGMLHEK